MLMASERHLSQSSYRGVVARFFGERRGESHYTVKPCKLPQPNVTVPRRCVGGRVRGAHDGAGARLKWEHSQARLVTAGMNLCILAAALMLF